MRPDISHAAAPETVRPPSSKWFVLTVLTLLAAMAYVDRTIISLLVDHIKADLTVSEVQMGLLQGVAFGLLYAVTTVPAGWLTDRYSRKKIILIAFAFWSAATASCGLARNFTTLFLARMGVGIGEAPLAPAAFSLLSQSFSRNRLASAINTYSAGATIGTALALTAGGVAVQALDRIGTIDLPLVGPVHAWQVTFMLTLIPALPVFVMACYLREPARTLNRADAPKADKGELRRFLVENRVVVAGHLFGYSMLSASVFGIAAWLPAMLMRRYGLDVAETGALVGALSILAGPIGTIFAGIAVDYIFARNVRDAHFRYFLFTGPLMIATAIAGFWYAPAIWVTGAVWAVMHFFWPFGGIAGAFLQIVAPPTLRGVVSGIYIFTYNFAGLLLGPTIVAVFTEYVFGGSAEVGKGMALTVAVCIPLMMLAFLAISGRVRRLVRQTEHQFA